MSGTFWATALAAHGIDRDQSAFQRKQVEQRGDGGDLIGLRAGLGLGGHEPLARGEGRDQVESIMAPLATAAPRGLAVDGDQLGRRAGERGDPGHEAPLEGLGVQRGEEVARMVVRGGTLGEGAQAAQKRQLARTEPGDVGEAPGPRQNGEKRQQQNLIQRTSHFPCLPVIRHIIEK